MNTIEHSDIIREIFKDLYFGEVISNNDTEKIKRIKIRVRGIFDEPISKEHIPWALPLGDGAVPVLGEEVAVLFIQGDHERPVYLHRGFLGSTRINFLLEIYDKIVTLKKTSAKKNIVVGTSTFSEPDTESVAGFDYFKDTNITPEDVAIETSEGVSVGSPTKGIMVEKSNESGKEVLSVFHPSGSSVEIQKNGDVIIHCKGDLYEIVEGNKNQYVIGDKLVKAGTVVLPGTVTPGATGPFNCLPNCVFSGALHAGNTVNGI